VSDEELEGADEFVLGKLHSLQQGSPQDRVLVDLLLRLRRTEELGEFLDLLGEITRFVNAYLDRGQYREVFYVVLYLHRESQNQDASGQDAKRDCLLDTVRMLVKGDVLDWLIQQMKSAGGEAEAEAAESILRALGKAGVVPVINTLCVERGLGARRRLVNVLVSIGEPSVPWAVKMLDDQRWFVVRNMVTVLGGVGSPEAQKALVRLSRDPDPRIRKEVARALGRGPVEEAEETLLALLEDRDQGVRLMAVKASAGHASRRVLDGVWRAYRKTPIRSAHWELKVVALHTLGRMGLGEAERLLLRVLCRRGWFFRDRWLRVRCAAARALGQIGGAVSGRVLARFRERGKPELRVAAARALAAMERRGEEGR
jgi:HEAT repeat protein